MRKALAGFAAKKNRCAFPIDRKPDESRIPPDPSGRFDDRRDTMSLTDPSPKVRLRRSVERGFEDFGWTDNYMTFSFSHYRDPEWTNFGPLRVIVENHIQPHSGFPAHSHRDVEIVTYVAAGALTHKDSFGHAADIAAGEMQLISAGSRGMVHSEENLRDEIEHNLQMWIIPDRTGTAFAYHQKNYAPEERQGRFRLYVSPGGEGGGMPINADARIYAGLFRPGDAVRHSLEPGRGAWIQIVRGESSVAGLTLEQGDGAGITDAPELEFRFEADSEVLLFDLRMEAPLLRR
jgi:redox-sensitive bicupin YhaK (pirin superfamily)